MLSLSTHLQLCTYDYQEEWVGTVAIQQSHIDVQISAHFAIYLCTKALMHVLKH